MEAQVDNILTIAGQVLLNSLFLVVPVVGVLALMTGLAARIAIVIEDFMYDRTHTGEMTTNKQRSENNDVA